MSATAGDRADSPSVLEEKLIASEERYQILLDAIQDYGIYMLDPEGRVVSWNAGPGRIYGYTAEEIVGRDFACLFPLRDIEAGRPAEALRLATAGGEYETEMTQIRKDGSEFLANLRLRATHDSRGTLRGFSEVCEDLSVSETSEARYRGLLEAAPDAMVVVDQAGTIVLLNVQAEKTFGYRRNELLGQSVTNLIPIGFAERLLADEERTTAEALAQQIGTGLELVGQRKDGSEFPIDIMLSPLESADGILVTAAIRDVSQRKAAEEALHRKVAELNRSNEELEQFAYLASHDLQEPLRMVSSYTQLLSQRYTGKLDADADDFIAFAVDGAARMQRLIQDLLVYSRVSTRGQSLSNVMSGEALAHALRNLSAAIAESGAVVTHDELPCVLGDEGQVTQLFQNLVGNGIKYRREEAPRVHISVEHGENQRAVFAVRDNGLGIEAQYFERIFGMFQRLHKREEFDGTGIGLAVCKKIVERHGGTLTVESQPGEGSVFSFDLPECDPAAPAVSPGGGEIQR